jgi:hypothetical protein
MSPFDKIQEKINNDFLKGIDKDKLEKAIAKKKAIFEGDKTVMK